MSTNRKEENTIGGKKFTKETENSLGLLSFDDEVENTSKSAPTVKYPKIKSSLGALDRFLTKNLALLLGIYAATMALCTGGLIINGAVFSQASSTEGTVGSADITLNTWLYSIIALFSFVVLLAAVYLIARKLRRTKTAKHAG